MSGEFTAPQLLGKDFDEAIEYVRKSSIGVPKKLEIDLSVAHDNLEISLAGNFIYMIETVNATDSLEIKFNERREPFFNLERQVGFFTPFYRLYISNAAIPTGRATLVYGTMARPFLDIIDNRSPISDTVEDMLEQLQGDILPEGYARVPVAVIATLIVAANAGRKSLFVQNDVGNTGNLYLGYTNLVTAINKFVTLIPGACWWIDDYRGDIWGMQTVAADLANYGEV